MSTGNTNFGNDQGTGTVGADGFLGGGLSFANNQITGVPQSIAAAGATQGAATAITNSLVIITTCTASARGIKLPTAATGLIVQVLSICTQGCKVYPYSGDKIMTSATNAAVVQAGLKGEIYYARNAVQWVVLKGA